MAKILIIGGGVAGLSAGIYAQLSGHRAVVCEKHFAAGGNLTAWNRGGYHIDNCIHWLTGTNPATSTYHMWETLGALGGVEVYQGKTLFTCEYEGQTLSLYNDLYKMRDRMLALSPEDEREILSFIRAVACLQGFCGIAGENHDEKISICDALTSVPLLKKYYGMTTGELSLKFSHPLLRLFFKGFFGEDFGSLALVFVCAHYCGNNGGIPRGSSEAMAQRMEERLRTLGGELLMKKEAVRILERKGKAYAVAFSDGSVIEADYVVLTADPASVFGKLTDRPLPKPLKRNYKNPRFRRFSAYQCAFACALSELPFEGDVIFEIPEEYRAQLLTDHLILREFSHEKDFAPEGENLLQTLTFTFEQDSRDFILLYRDDREAYNERKRMISSLMLRLIEEKFPQMAGKLRCIDVWTPATYRRFTNADVGSFMSFALPSKALPLCLGNRIRGLSNVILATQWQQAPGGLPIAAEVGKKAIAAIDHKERNYKKYKKTKTGESHEKN